MSDENPVVTEPVAVLPDAVAAALPKVDNNYGVDAFFKDEPSVVKPVEVANPAAVSADDAPPVKTSLAAQLAAKNKPAAAKVEPVAAPVVTPPVAEAHPEDKLELDAKASTATREHFKTLKTVTKDLRGSIAAKEAEVAELRTKLETAAKAPSATEAAELAKLREESKALSDRLLLIDTQNHPKFKAQFVEPKNQALASAKELLGDKGNDVGKLMNLPRAELGKAVQELTKDMPDMDRLDIAAHVKKAWELEQAGKEALGKAGDTYSAIRSKTVEEQKASFSTTFDKLVPSLLEHMVKLEVPANATTQQRQEIENYNNGAHKIRETAEKVALGAIDQEAIVANAAKSAAYDFHINHAMPRLLSEVSEMQETIAGLTKELNMYRGKNPNKGISASTVESHAAAKPQTIEELADAHFK